MLDVIPFRRPGPGVTIWCEDPSLGVERRGPAYKLSGQVEHEFPDGTTLHLDAEALDVELDVPLALNSRPADAARALERNLPRGLAIDVRRDGEDVLVKVIQTVVPAAKLPTVRVFVSDPSLRVKMIAPNEFELEGTTGFACQLALQIDSFRTTIELGERVSAAAAAEKASSAVPRGYFAKHDGARVAIFKDADLRRQAA